MIKEAKNIDFYTTGRQPSEQELMRISEWIKNNKRKNLTPKSTIHSAKQNNHLAEQKVLEQSVSSK